MKKSILAVVILLCLGSCVRADDNIVIVFDNSGSMSGYMRTAKKPRMQVAQEAMISVLSKVPPTTKVGILTFNGWIYDLQPADQEKLQAAIRGVRPGGGTPLFQYIKDGANRLLQERVKQNNVGYYKLLVVTDGEAQDTNLNQDGEWNDGSFKPGVLKDTISRGIVVDAIGLEMRQDHALKTQINGAYMRGDDPGSIEQSLKKAVAEVGFDGKDGLSQEAFDTISGLPENFVLASLKGLTEFRNHGIGEKPPVFVVKDGLLVSVPADDVAKPSSGLGWGWGILIILGGGVVVVVIVIAIVSSNQKA